MSLSEELDNARSKAASGNAGFSLIDRIMEKLSNEDQRSLKSALADFDVSRGLHRVPATQLQEILGRHGHEVSVSTITGYRKKQGYKRQAQAAHEATPV